MTHAAPAPLPVDLMALGADDLSFFVDEGLPNLLRAMLKQSIKDILLDRKDARGPADISASARWPDSKVGRDCIEFLMPGVTSERVVAKIYEDPQKVLDAMESVESAPGYSSQAVHTFSLDGTPAESLADADFGDEADTVEECERS